MYSLLTVQLVVETQELPDCPEQRCRVARAFDLIQSDKIRLRGRAPNRSYWLVQSQTRPAVLHDVVCHGSSVLCRCEDAIKRGINSPVRCKHAVAVRLVAMARRMMR